MCQAKPGPRCSSDMRRSLASAQRRLSIAQAKGNDAQIALMERNLEVSVLDYASTPDGRREALTAAETTVPVGADDAQLRMETRFDPSTDRITATLIDPATGDTIGVYDARGIEAASDSVLQSRSQTPLSEQQLTNMRHQAQEVAAHYDVHRTGVALDHARRDQVTLMPERIREGEAGYSSYLRLGEARDHLALAEARYGVMAASNRPIPHDVQQGLDAATRSVRGAEVQLRCVRSASPDPQGVKAMPANVRSRFEAQMADPSTRPLERNALIASSHEYAVDQQWGTFSRPGYGQGQLKPRPPAPWVRHTRPLADADLSRLSQVCDAQEMAVYGVGEDRLVVVKDGAERVEQLWAAGYSTRMPKEGDVDLVVMAGPNLVGWGGGQRARVAS